MDVITSASAVTRHDEKPRSAVKEEPTFHVAQGESSAAEMSSEQFRSENVMFSTSSQGRHMSPRPSSQDLSGEDGYEDDVVSLSQTEKHGRCMSSSPSNQDFSGGDGCEDVPPSQAEEQPSDDDPATTAILLAERRQLEEENSELRKMKSALKAQITRQSEEINEKYKRWFQEEIRRFVRQRWAVDKMELELEEQKAALEKSKLKHLVAERLILQVNDQLDVLLDSADKQQSLLEFRDFLSGIVQDAASEDHRIELEDLEKKYDREAKVLHGSVEWIDVFMKSLERLDDPDIDAHKTLEAHEEDSFLQGYSQGMTDFARLSTVESNNGKIPENSED
ncbi:hypothetical protein BU24DRAFT_454814 [Aaosphaeria arxii CBS 175.79]|uniref:Uncharacterized protein n=1 Tax=Aaosphaeria arxii CBS 175.79 TaxID=1450172 RepID=A0A6A5XC97_9PLEO|nr:uncharacterized protein BU24DRAFT_454814 [Aaosphaeria arxii CBS 175.79]KAF2010446.1 hypothetical protein BU24DRAFT_454814 [Aaosphaeria arxii CBS 175.79]